MPCNESSLSRITFFYVALLTYELRVEDIYSLFKNWSGSLCQRHLDSPGSVSRCNKASFHSWLRGQLMSGTYSRLTAQRGAARVCILLGQEHTRVLPVQMCVQPVHQNKGCTSRMHQKVSGGTVPLGGAAAFKASTFLKYGGKLEEKQPQMHRKHADALKAFPLPQVLLFQLSHPQLSRTPLMFSPPVLHTIFHPPLLFPLTALNRGLTVWADGGRVGGARGSAVAAGSVLREGFHEVPQQHPGNQWLHWGPFSLLGQPGFLWLLNPKLL